MIQSNTFYEPLGQPLVKFCFSSGQLLIMIAAFICFNTQTGETFIRQSIMSQFYLPRMNVKYAHEDISNFKQHSTPSPHPLPSASVHHITIIGSTSEWMHEKCTK